MCSHLAATPFAIWFFRPLFLENRFTDFTVNTLHKLSVYWIKDHCIDWESCSWYCTPHWKASRLTVHFQFKSTSGFGWMGRSELCVTAVKRSRILLLSPRFSPHFCFACLTKINIEQCWSFLARPISYYLSQLPTTAFVSSDTNIWDFTAMTAKG